MTTLFESECPAVALVHCCAHSLNLYLHYAGIKLVCFKDALETIREFSKN